MTGPIDNPETLRRVRLFEALCANPIDVVVVLGTDARYRYLSPSVETVLGYRPDEIVGRLCFDFYHPDDVPRIQRATDEGFARARIPRPVVMRVRHQEGHYVWMEATASPVFDPATGGIIEILGVNRDISDRMRLEHELYEAQRAETAARLASSATHDLNNLLTVIAGLGEGLEETFADEVEARADARAIREAALHAGKLTRHLLGLSRPTELETEIFDVNEVVERVAAMAGRVDQRACHVVTRLDGSSPQLRGEPARLEQVLLNLTLNACAAGDGDPVEVILTSRRDGERVVVTCADDGAGIAPEHVEHVFEPHFTTRRDRGGSGIGLSTARRIVEGWGGTISVESTSGEGAVFTVSLPAAGAGAGAVARGPETVTGERVLVIEPEPALRDAIRRFLGHTGYTCTCVTSEEEAIRAFEEMADLAMIVADDRPSGWELARALRVRRPTPVILMSASGEPPDDLAPDEVYLSKPFSSGDLTGAVRRLLRMPAA